MGVLNRLKYLPTINEIQGGLGEYLTKFVATIDIPEVLVLRDILIDGYSENTSQIDLLFIGEKGIYVTEVKMYPDARIYGDGKKKQWYYYKHGKKYDIYSPCLQNSNHIKYLKEFLKNFGEIPCFSIIVLICEDVKVSNINEDPNNPDTVIITGLPQLRKAMEMAANGKPVALSKENKQAIYEFIKENQYQGREKRLEHKERVKVINDEKSEALNNKLCPYCKSELLLRQGKYGNFYGCSNFPKCKFTSKA